MKGRRALVVGVGATTYGNVFSLLPGAARDVKLVSECLAGKGFGPGDVVTLSGREATAEAVQAALLSLVSATAPGELAVFYFNGHGYQFRDRGGEQAEELDESLVCADKPIADDWFFHHLWPRARAGANFAFIVDACHAETAVLHIDRFRTRGLARLITGPAFVARPQRPLVREESPYWRLVLAACGDAEISVASTSTTDGGGVATEAMLDALKGNPKVRYRELWQTVARDVRSHYQRWGAGTPVIRYCGPDDRLLDSEAFQLP